MDSQWTTLQQKRFVIACDVVCCKLLNQSGARMTNQQKKNLNECKRTQQTSPLCCFFSRTVFPAHVETEKATLWVNDKSCLRALMNNVVLTEPKCSQFLAV